MLGSSIMTLPIVIASTALCFACLVSCTEEKSKFEWACLQQIEAQERSNHSDEALIFKILHDVEMVGIRSPHHVQRIWVLLNPTIEPYYKQMPSTGDYQLSKEQMEIMKLRPGISPTVLAVFDSHRGETESGL
jgi:hypothetical protein